ncbi:hypothetical protein ACVDG8_027715 [Mesorhizobium sp. ORM8.1]
MYGGATALFSNVEIGSSNIKADQRRQAKRLAGDRQQAERATDRQPAAQPDSGRL